MFFGVWEEQRFLYGVKVVICSRGVDLHAGTFKDFKQIGFGSRRSFCALTFTSTCVSEGLYDDDDILTRGCMNYLQSFPTI